MRPHFLRFITVEDIELFEKIRNAVNLLPDLDLGKDEDGLSVILSCHILCRAVADVFSLKYADGYFYANCEHSWIVTPNKNIIDVYPVAILGGPILIHGETFSPTSWLYRTMTIERMSSEFNKPYFLNAVQTVSSHLTR